MKSFETSCQNETAAAAVDTQVIEFKGQSMISVADFVGSIEDALLGERDFTKQRNRAKDASEKFIHDVRTHRVEAGEVNARSAVVIFRIARQKLNEFSGLTPQEMETRNYIDRLLQVAVSEVEPDTRR
jgi:hypothetical protein